MQEQVQNNKLEKKLQEIDPCLIGGVGDYVKEVANYTEGDPLAIYLHCLSHLSVLLGRNVKIGGVAGGEMYLNVQVVFVGDSGFSRKGTAYKVAQSFFKTENNNFNPVKIVSGLGSGQGLIKTLEVQRNILLIEEEFTSLLKNCLRRSDKTSDFLRKAYDMSAPLENITKDRHLCAHAYFLSMNSHVTQESLKEFFNSNNSSLKSEMTNGFLNRMAFFNVSRAQVIADGVGFENKKNSSRINELKRGVANYVEQAISERFTLSLSSEAKEVWRPFYEGYEGRHVSFMSSMLVRGTDYALKFAGLFAALDGVSVISAKHLQAAIHLWKISEDSCWSIFSNIGTACEQKIIRVLKDSSSGSLTQTEVNNDVFKRNVNSAVQRQAIDELHEKGLISISKELVNGSNRPTTVYSLTEKGLRNEI